MISKYITRLNHIKSIVKHHIKLKSIIYTTFLDKTYQSYHFTHNNETYGMTLTVGNNNYTHLEVFGTAPDNDFFYESSDYNLSTDENIRTFIEDVIATLNFKGHKIEEECTFSDLFVSDIL